MLRYLFQFLEHNGIESHYLYELTEYLYGFILPRYICFFGDHGKCPTGKRMKEFS